MRTLSKDWENIDLIVVTTIIELWIMSHLMNPIAFEYLVWNNVKMDEACSYKEVLNETILILCMAKCIINFITIPFLKGLTCHYLNRFTFVLKVNIIIIFNHVL